MYDPSFPLLWLTSAAAVMCVKAIPQTKQPVDFLAADFEACAPMGWFRSSFSQTDKVSPCF